MVEEMQVRRYAETMQAAYVRWVSAVAKYYHKSPDQLSREEVRRWFVYFTNERKVSHSSVTTALSALEFFYIETIDRLMTPLVAMAEWEQTDAAASGEPG